MTIKLKQGFFKVSQYNPYTPLPARHYGYEADTKFEIRMEGGTTRASYYGVSHGMGKVLSVFKTEYFLFHNGATQIQYVAPDGTVGVLLNLVGVDDAALITMDNNFLVATLSGDTITIKSYLIVGAQGNMWAELLETKTIDLPIGYTFHTPFSVCRATDTDVYIMRSNVSGAAKTLKILTDTTLDPSVSLSWQDGDFADMPIPIVGALLRNVHNRYFYSNIYGHYIVKNGSTYALYDNATNSQIWSITISADVVDFYLDDNGEGYAVSGTFQNVTGATLIGNVYSISNGSATQIASASGGTAGLTSPGYNPAKGTGGFMPLIDDTLAPIQQQARSNSSPAKVVPTTTSVSVTSTSENFTTFGTGIRFV